MSEASPQPAEPSPGPSPEPAPKSAPDAAPASVSEPQAKPRKKRRWLRRIRITLLMLLILIFGLRIALNYLLPSVLRKVAARYDLDCTFERSELALLGGDFGLWHLDLKPKAGGESLLHAGYCRGKVSVWELIKGNLDIWRLEADGVDVSVERLADGRIPLIERFLKADTTAPGTQKQPPTAQDKPEKFQLASPLKIDALRVQQLKVRLRDRAVTPAVETTVVATLRVSDLGSTIRPARTELNIEASEVLDALIVRAERAGNSTQADANVELIVRGLRPRGLAGYLEPLGIHPVAEGINAHAAGKARAVLTTQPAGAPPTISGQLALHDVAVTADGETAAAIKTLTLDVNSANTASANLGSLAIDGVRLAGRRTAAGRVRVAGVELVQRAQGPTTRPAGASSRPAPELPATRLAQAPSTGPATIGAATRAAPFLLLFSDVKIRDVRLEFVDELQSPPLLLAVLLDDLSTRDLVLDAAGNLPTLNLTGTMRIPGVVSVMKLDGSIQPFTPRKSLDVTLTAEGVAPELLRPYLLAAGLEPTLRAGTLSCAIKSDFELDARGRLIAQAHLKGVKLTDGPTLFELGDTTIDGFASDPARGTIRLEAVAINGPSLPIKRHADGRISLMGFRSVPARAPAGAPASPPITSSAAPNARPSSPPSTASSTSTGFPRLEIGKLTWNNLKLDLSDDMTKPPTATSLTDVGLEITNLALDADPARPVSQPGRIKAHLSAPNLARTLTLEGTITPNPKALALDLAITGEGLSAATIQSYLEPLGIQPTLKDGSLRATAKLNLKQDAGALSASLALANVALADGAGELAGVESVRVQDLVQKPGLLTVGEIEIVRPRTSVIREKDGTLIVAGVKLLKAESPAPIQAAAPSSPATQPAPAALGPASSPAPATVTGLSKIRVTDAAITWTDRAITPAVTTTLRTSVELDQFVVGSADAKPSPIRITASADSGLKEFTLTGNVLLAPNRQSASLEIAAAGIAPAAIYAYLPPGLQIATTDGRLKTSIDASVSQNAAGGTSAKVHISGIDYRDDAAPVPLFKLDSMNLVAPRIDPAKHLIAIDEVSVAGLETDVRLEPGNVVRLLGLTIQPPPAGTTGSPKPASAPVEAPTAAATQPAPAGPAPDVAALVAQSRRVPTVVTAEKVDLHIRRATLTDATRPAAAPITLADVRFKNLQRIEWAGAEAASHPPTRFELTGRVDPVVSQFKLSAAVAPFAHQPTAQLDLLVSGIKGDGLTAIQPELKRTLDGSKLTDGRLAAHLESTLTLERRGAGNLDLFTLGEELQKGFAADVVLKNVEYRAVPNGPVLAGLEELRTENAQVRPKTGSVIIKSMEITKPLGSVMRDAQGIHALGWTLKAPATQPSTQPATQPATHPASAQLAHATPPATHRAASTAPRMKTPSTAPSTGPAGEIRIDQLIVSGLDLRLEDTTSTPPFVLPLTGLDVEAKGLSNYALYEERPIRFTALVSSGKVSLPRRPKGAGIPRLLADLAAAQKEPAVPAREEREFFSQITASGNVTLYPRLRGWVKTAVNGFEVAGLAGPAKQMGGVTLGGGVFDSNVDLRFNEDDRIEVKSRHVFTDLLMSEPKDGPIAKNLKLAGGLDTTIRALQDVDGSITLPVKVQVADGKIEGLGGAAIGAVSRVIAIAIASAPVKVVAGVGDLLGVGGGKVRGAEEPRTIQFRAGYTGLEPEQSAIVAEVIQRMHKDHAMEVTLRHELGGGDIPVAEARANPPAAEAAALADQLRSRKIELSRVRSEVAGAVKAQLAYQVADQTSATIEQLRAIDRELARTEDALDKVYELMRPGAERQGARRTRQAAIEFGRDRLESVRLQLLASDLPDIARRVRVLNPGFNPSEDEAAGGKVILILVAKKRQQ